MGSQHLLVISLLSHLNSVSECSSIAVPSPDRAKLSWSTQNFIGVLQPPVTHYTFKSSCDTEEHEPIL